jgi:hypothetical protein
MGVMCLASRVVRTGGPKTVLFETPKMERNDPLFTGLRKGIFDVCNTL